MYFFACLFPRPRYFCFQSLTSGKSVLGHVVRSSRIREDTSPKRVVTSQRIERDWEKAVQELGNFFATISISCDQEQKQNVTWLTEARFVFPRARQWLNQSVAFI